MTSGVKVLHPGILSLIQDSGRFGMAKLGLSTGGPADKLAFDWLNRLLGNKENSTAIEVSLGGLKLQAQKPLSVCVTGAEADLMINGGLVQRWQTHRLATGDVLELGYARAGVRCYVGVKGGFKIPPQFSSCATVLREKIGGLNGERLNRGDVLPAEQSSDLRRFRLLQQDIPSYPSEVRLRVIPGYQQQAISRIQQRRFFSGEYRVSPQWDRMGYRLQGPKIETKVSKMLSEGIALGAIQLPPDGQPIVLLQDRQTIGGYPKLGSVLSLDLYRLAQVGQGAKVYFEPISMDCAHNELHFAKRRFSKTKLIVSN